MTEGQTRPDRLLRTGVRDAGLPVTGIEVIALAISLIWLVGTVLFFFVFAGGEGEAQALDRLRSVMTLVAIVLPIAMVWVAALAARTVQTVHEESQRLQASIDALRQSHVADRQARGAGVESSVERKLDEIARATQKTEAALATFATSRPTARVAPAPTREARANAPAADQPSLALGTTAEDLAPPLSRPDLVRALNFPDTEGDEVGFAALRRALKDRTAKQLIQASQDVLTLLSQDGIYMDDLTPDRARPEVWRKFAAGERGKSVASLGGVRDRSSLALTAARMREDTIFRDAAHHFLRKYDQMLVDFEQNASDEDLAALAETRTSRAFMLLGRVTGAFD
ncbi:hypothetical protein [Thalassorhabdomicrobium marinisediminis]|uniref:Uncharacterized protein n=1 Tax=Thalassorhabdomicrobium marinisediminis TaxID=2170577 RepID=A0A2T7FYV9_9RHOB|nr:hypothetical protein [Thalassorhabdomicrobium marinisediminis]PVA07352.1 hypothetical protein DC363_05770 [Thalassorhabdomicrobium marinisediminis]